MEIEDTNDGERKIMTMWNDHMTSYPYQSIGFRGLEQVLREFVPKISSVYLGSKDRLMMGNFLLHMSSMVQGGLITHRTVLSTATLLQENLAAGRRRQRDEGIRKRDYLAQFDITSLK